MNKPQGYDQSEAFTGEFKNIAPGGHICKIISAKVTRTQSDKEQLVIMFDIIDGESKYFYTESFKKKFEANPDAKWQGIYRQLTDGNSLKFFKGMITAIENSNSGYKWDWDEATLKDKLFGGLFGQEEFLNNNQEIKLSTKLQYIRSVEQIRKGVEVPAIKKLKVNNSTFDTSAFGTDLPAEEFPPNW